MLIKIHKSYRDVIAICDENLVGQVFEEDDKILDVKESFYNGEKITEEELLKKLSGMYKEDATFNVVGEKSIKVALESGIINLESIKRIKNIPFVLILL